MFLAFLKKYVWLLNLVLLAGIAYSLATVVNSGLRERILPVYGDAGATPLNRLSGSYTKRFPKSSYDVIMERNLFGITSTPPVGMGADNGVDDHSLSVSNLKLELLGTLIKSESVVEASSLSREFTKKKKSTAIIKNLDTNKVSSYSEGEVIDIYSTEVVKLYRVRNCAITIERRKRSFESIKCIKDLKAKPKVASKIRYRKNTEGAGIINRNEAHGVNMISEGNYEIDRKFLDEMLGDPNKLLTQARVVPQDDGLKFLAVRRSSVFYSIGLRNGDILHKINNVEMGNLENALGLFEDLKDQSHFSINLTRAGKKRSHEYTVK